MVSASAPVRTLDSRTGLKALAGTIGGTALAWALCHSGATETWELYRLFLWLLASALILAWTLPSGDWRGPSSSVLLLTGCYLLAQTALQPSLESRGYALATIGWLSLFISLGLAVQGRRAARGIFSFLLLAGGTEALYGLSQLLSEPDPIGYRFQIHGITGTFVNHNHFAGLINMTLPLATGVLLASFGRRRSNRSPSFESYAWTWLVLLFCSFMGLATLLSLSRGGVLTLLSTLAFMGLLLTVNRRRSSARGLPGRVVWLLPLTVLGLGLAVGLDALKQNFESFSESTENRLGIYADSLQLIGDHPVLGVGPGMYRWRFRPYQTSHHEFRYDHAHNDYLETAADWGAPTAILFWIFVVWRFTCACRRFLASDDPWRQGLAFGCAGAIFSILIHSLVDFNLQIPANLAIFCAILGLAWSLEQPHAAAQSPVAQGEWRPTP